MTHFYAGDDIPLKIEFTIDCVAQLPLTGTVKIVDEFNNVIVPAGTAVSNITTSVATYNHNNATEGNFAILFTLDFGDAKITRGFFFRVAPLDYETLD